MCGAFILHTCTCVHTHGLMPHMFFAFVHVVHKRVAFRLWVICTVHTHTYINFVEKSNFKKPSICQPALKSSQFIYIRMHVCMYNCNLMNGWIERYKAIVMNCTQVILTFNKLP